MNHVKQPMRWQRSQTGANNDVSIDYDLLLTLPHSFHSRNRRIKGVKNGLQVTRMAFKFCALLIGTLQKRVFHISLSLPLSNHVAHTVAAHSSLCCYCVHLYCVSECDSTDVVLRVISASPQTWLLYRIPFLPVRSDESDVPATCFF